MELDAIARFMRANRKPAIAWYLERAEGFAAHVNVLEVITGVAARLIQAPRVSKRS